MELITVTVPAIFIRDAGDIVDRWAIAKLKAERISSEEMNKEYLSFEEGREYLKKQNPTLEWELLCKMLYDVHAFLWNFEAGTKSGKEHLPEPTYIYAPENDPVLAKMGVITIEVRNYNHIRIAIRNYINKTLGQGFQEIKKDHCSE